MSDYLIHYGVKGMKWGVRKERRYLGNDGRLTERGQKKFNKQLIKTLRRDDKARQDTFAKRNTSNRDAVLRAAQKDFYKTRQSYLKSKKPNDHIKEFEQYDRFETAAAQVAKKYERKYAEATMKDLKIPNYEGVVSMVSNAGYGRYTLDQLRKDLQAKEYKR